MKLWIIPLMLFALFAALMAHEDAARAFGVGREGKGMGKLGAAGSKGSNGIAPGCTMNGIFDLTNTCNDIYLMGRVL